MKELLHWESLHWQGLGLVFCGGGAHHTGTEARVTGRRVLEESMGMGLGVRKLGSEYLHCVGSQRWLSG